MKEVRRNVLEEKLGKKKSLFTFKSEKNIIVATYLPYNLEFVYVSGGKYNKGLSLVEREQAKKLNDDIFFDDTEMEYEEEIAVADILVTRTPIINLFAQKYVNIEYFKGEEKYAAYLRKENVDILCDQLDLRLPTENEWEYFVRAGSQDLFTFGKQLPSEAELNKWLSLDFSNLDSINCNKFGLYGIYTGEWCEDKYRKNSDSEFEKGYVIKGGGAYFWPWQSDEWIWCMSAMRMSSDGLIDGECGVRLVYDLNKWA